MVPSCWDLDGVFLEFKSPFQIKGKRTICSCSAWLGEGVARRLEARQHEDALVLRKEMYIIEPRLLS